MNLFTVVDASPKVGEIAGMDVVTHAIQAIRKDCYDYHRHPGKWELRPGKGIIYLNVDGQDYVMTEKALRQYWELLGLKISNAYVRQMLLFDKADLAVTNFDAWDFKLREYLIRCYQGEVRAFLTDEYNEYSNEEFASTLEECLLEQSGSVFAVSSYLVNQYWMEINIREHQSFYHDFTLGLRFTHSETGNGSAGIYITLVTPKNTTLVMKNWSSKAFVRQAHRGKIEMDEKIRRFVDSVEALRDELQTAIEHAEGKQIDVEAEIEKVSTAIRLSKKRTEELSKRFSKGKMSLLEFALELSAYGQEKGRDLLREDVEKYTGSLVGRA